uniref:Uncharacterized protein n=1 Tax=Ditylenchus dipsaci TaxID=166011 RepID=A0A915EVM0_9BILA
MRVSESNTEAGDPPPRAKNMPTMPRQQGDPATARRVTNWIDVNPGGLSTARKRKVRQLSPADPETTRIHKSRQDTSISWIF